MCCAWDECCTCSTLVIILNLGKQSITGHRFFSPVNLVLSDYSSFNSHHLLFQSCYWGTEQEWESLQLHDTTVMQMFCFFFQELLLDRNCLTAVPSSSLNGPRALKVLSLSHNRIGMLADCLYCLTSTAPIKEKSCEVPFFTLNYLKLFHNFLKTCVMKRFIGLFLHTSNYSFNVHNNYIIYCFCACVHAQKPVD